MRQTINELTETEKAYLAGFIDGEGCISAREYKRQKSTNPSARLNLSIVQANMEFLQKWCARVGAGKVHELPGGKLSKRQAYQWQIYNSEAEQVLRMVLPYLDVKRSQAEIALKFRDTFVSWMPCRRGLSEKTVALRRQYAEQLVALKRPIPENASER